MGPWRRQPSLPLEQKPLHPLQRRQESAGNPTGERPHQHGMERDAPETLQIQIPPGCHERPGAAEDTKEPNQPRRRRRHTRRGRGGTRCNQAAKRRPHGSCLLLALVLAALDGCHDAPARPASPRPVRVWAAASLAEVIPPLLHRWSATSGRPTRLALDGTSRLARQLAAGAPADIFLSADVRWARRLAARGLLRSETMRRLGRNEIVLVVPAGTSCQPFETPADLLRRWRRIATADSDVPAGHAADTALRILGLGASVRQRLVRAPHVRAALAWVARSEVDGAFVYATDARAEPRVRVAARLPSKASEDLEVWGAVTARSSLPSEAASLLDFLASEEGSEAFRQAGWR